MMGCQGRGATDFLCQFGTQDFPSELGANEIVQLFPCCALGLRESVAQNLRQGAQKALSKVGKGIWFKTHGKVTFANVLDDFIYKFNVRTCRQERCKVRMSIVPVGLLIDARNKLTQHLKDTIKELYN